MKEGERSGRIAIGIKYNRAASSEIPPRRGLARIDKPKPHPPCFQFLVEGKLFRKLFNLFLSSGEIPTYFVPIR